MLCECRTLTFKLPVSLQVVFDTSFAFLVLEHPSNILLESLLRDDARAERVLLSASTATCTVRDRFAIVQDVPYPHESSFLHLIRSLMKERV